MNVSKHLKTILELLHNCNEFKNARKPFHSGKINAVKTNSSILFFEAE